MTRKALIVLICGSIILSLSFGIRQTFGLFLKPITTDLQVGREVFGMSMAISALLSGLSSPFFGGLADKFGAGRVLLAGGLLYAAGLVLTTVSAHPAELYLTFGVLIGLAMGSATFGIVLGVVGRAVPAEKRSLAFGITTACGSMGSFILVPAGRGLLETFGWHTSFLIFAVLAASICILALGLAGRPAARAGESQTLTNALGEAGRHSGFLLLNAGFFVCGFHVTFIATHLPAFLADRGVSLRAAAYALALIGLFNVLGSFYFGAAGGRYRKKYVLSIIYLARAVVISLFLLLPVTDMSALFFGAAIGFLWLGTVPLTNGIIAQVFGPQYMSMLGGLVFMWHQVGAFLGAWLGGYFFDLTGSYDVVWLAAVALGIFAALIHLPIADAPVARLRRPAVAT